MSKLKSRPWSERKKNLPKNWCEIVAKALTDNGYEMSPSKVSDVRAGKIANLETQELVWSEIAKLERTYKRKKTKLSSFIAA